MKPRRPAARGIARAAAGLVVAWAAAAQGPDEEAWWRHEPPPEGPVILERMREALPREPVEVRGALLPRGPDAGDEPALDAVLLLDWGGTPPRAAFELRRTDSGEFVAGFLVERPSGRPAVYRSVRPDGALAEARPDEAAWTTAFTWRDLAFDYLWWERAETAGVALRRQRRCYLVDVFNPDPGAEEAVIRLWVDDATYALLQAQTRDAAGRPLRELSVKSLRRVGREWRVEDIEVRDLRSGRRTLLRILGPGEPAVP